MQPFTAYFDLSLKSGKIVLCVRMEFVSLSKHNQAFDGLRQQKLMMKRYICTSVFKRKNNPDPHPLRQLSVKNIKNTAKKSKIAVS